MKWRLQVPSKTFILGEYAVLEGGLCLGAATTPIFEMAVTSSEKNHRVLHSIHPESPAGNFLSEHQEAFKNLNIQFVDPLSGLGGFGASTAQYLGLWAFREMVLKERSRDDLLQANSIKEMIHEYRNYSSRKQGRAPSGADVVMQLCGGLTWIDTSSWEVQELSWPWPELTGFFISTGNKLATHSHLQDLSDFNPSELFRILHQARSEFKSEDADLWLESVKYYSQALEMLGLVAPETRSLLNLMSELPGVKACKGCGAMGADVIFVVVNSTEVEAVNKYALKNKLKIIASTRDFSSGIRIHNEFSSRKQELSHD